LYSAESEHTEQQSHMKMAFKIPLYDDKWQDNLLSVTVSKGKDF